MLGVGDQCQVQSAASGVSDQCQAQLNSVNILISVRYHCQCQVSVNSVRHRDQRPVLVIGVRYLQTCH